VDPPDVVGLHTGIDVTGGRIGPDTDTTTGHSTDAVRRLVRFSPLPMARMHTRRRGTSGSDRPVADEPPEWSDVDADDVEARVVELAEQGYSQAEIGLKLRDEGITGTPVPNVKLATGKKVGDILAENDATPEIPEDLRNLMEKAVRVREHLAENGQDHQNKRALQNVESKIRRLVNYYRGDELDAEFKYTYENAKDLLE